MERRAAARGHLRPQGEVLPKNQQIISIGSECAADTLFEAHWKAAQASCQDSLRLADCPDCSRSAQIHANVSHFHFAQALGTAMQKFGEDHKVQEVIHWLHREALKRHAPETRAIPPVRQTYFQGLPA